MNALLSISLAAPIEALLNAVLQQDAAATRRLTSLSGKAVTLQCTTGLPCRLTLVVEEQRISLRSTYEGTPDATLTATAGALLRLATGGSRTDALFNPEIALAGDTHVIESLASLIQDLEIDWEAHFASVLGDVITYPLSQLTRRAHQWGTRTAASLHQDIHEYLHEEIAVLPTRSEVAQFGNRLDELRLTLDRAQARLRQLDMQLTPRPDAPHTASH